MRADLLNKLYSKTKTALEFKFDTLVSPPLFYYINPYCIQELRKIALSKDRIKVKRAKIDSLLKPLGFRLFCAGTNRVVYAPYEDKNVLLKIAIDPVGMNDGPKEFYNQTLLKPFCTKVFAVSPCGTVSLVERVEPIVSIEEFKYIADDVFYILYNKIIGKYILQDIGTDYFMNWGIRRGFGPCLLDFPYVFIIDGRKLYCSKPLIQGQKFPVCGGEIDYDAGFNNLICTKCGKKYIAEDLGMDKAHTVSRSESKIIIRGGNQMKVQLMEGKKIVAQSERAREVIPQFDEAKKKKHTNKGKPMKVQLFDGDTLCAESNEEVSDTIHREREKNKKRYSNIVHPVKVSLSGPTEGSNTININSPDVDIIDGPEQEETPKYYDPSLHEENDIIDEKDCGTDTEPEPQHINPVTRNSKFIPDDDEDDDYKRREGRKAKFNNKPKRRKGKKNLTLNDIGDYDSDYFGGY